MTPGRFVRKEEPNRGALRPVCRSEYVPSLARRTGWTWRTSRVNSDTPGGCVSVRQAEGGSGRSAVIGPGLDAARFLGEREHPDAAQIRQEHGPPFWAIAQTPAVEAWAALIRSSGVERAAGPDEEEIIRLAGVRAGRVLSS